MKKRITYTVIFSSLVLFSACKFLKSSDDAINEKSATKAVEVEVKKTIKKPTPKIDLEKKDKLEGIQKAENQELLGKWYDAPRHFSTWFVCEQSNVNACLKGWSRFENSCYVFSDTLENYDDASSICAELSAHLVSIQSAEENAHVQSLCGKKTCWIGLSEPADSEEWFWPDTSAVGKEGAWTAYTNWHANEPNNYNGNDEDATFMNLWVHLGVPMPRSPNAIQEHLGKWHDGPRDLPLWYVCERPNTDACAQEGWRAFDASCYQLNKTLTPYDEATQDCVEKQANLVSIQSAEENDFVQSLCERHSCWLGLAEPMDSEEWLWPNQATVGTKGKWSGYTNWDAGEPNNHGGKDEEVTFMNYWGSLNMPLPRSEAHIQRHLGKWYDGGRQMRIWYVCERIYVDEKVCEDEAWQHFNGSCYKFNETRADYESAVSACDAQGAQLVKIESAEENAYVQGLCGRKTCWLGLAEPPDSEDWYWVDGTKANLESNWFGKMDWKGYTNWDWGEPNNHNGTDEDATFMNLWLHLGMLEPWSVEH